VKDPDAPAGLVLPDEGGFSARDPVTGAETARWAVDGLPADGSASVIGPVVVLRLEERVVGYR
jgi:hypothetical protein